MMNTISKCLFLLSMFFTFNIFAIDTEIPQPKADQECWLFIGGPGVGKRTLRDALLRKNIPHDRFNSCLRIKSYEDLENNRIYVYTPGLADIVMKERLAKEINKGLKQPGKYKLFFVVQLNQGRVIPEDVVIINTVMNAIELEDKPFNIIINKLEEDEKEILNEDVLLKAEILNKLNSGNNKTHSVWYIERSYKLRNKKIPVLELDDDIKEFFNTRKAIKIPEEKVPPLKEVIQISKEDLLQLFEIQIESTCEVLESEKHKKLLVQCMLEEFSRVLAQSTDLPALRRYFSSTILRTIQAYDEDRIQNLEKIKITQLRIGELVSKANVIKINY